MLTIYDLFEKSTQVRPDHTALVKDGLRITYRELGKRVNSLAYSLHQLGVTTGNRVGIMFRNCFEYAEIFYAIQKLGAVAVPFCFAFKDAELIYNLKNSQCTAFIYQSDYVRQVAGIKKDVPNVSLYIHNGDGFSDGEYNLEKLTQDGNSNWQFECKVSHEDEAMFLFTSGSTGMSKCVVHTQEGLLSFVSLPQIENSCFNKDDIMLYYAPLYHMAGMTYLMYLMSVGGTLVLTDGFDPVAVLRLWQEEKVTQTLLIPPSLISRIQLCEGYEKADLSSMRRVVMSGGANAPMYAQQVFEKFPNAIITNNYGHSERAARTTLFLTREEFYNDQNLVNSVGRLAQYSEIKLIGEDGKPANPGEAYARAPGMLKGYLNMESPFVDGWFPTGDFLRLDDEGYYWFMDRVKSMIKTGGENVFTTKVENAIKLHPAVLNCAVVGLPDPIYAEAVSAAVVLKPGASITRMELREFCGQYLSNFEKPRNVYIVDELPLTATGKIQKPNLIEQLKASTPIV